MFAFFNNLLVATITLADSSSTNNEQLKQQGRQDEASKAYNDPSPVPGHPAAISTQPAPDKTTNSEIDSLEAYFWPPTPQNIFSCLLVLVGAGQIYWLKRTMEATKEAADAARDNALVAIRQSGPYLRITHFRLYQPQAGEAPEEAGIIIAFANRGGGNAFVTNMRLSVAPLAALPDVPSYAPLTLQQTNGLTIAPGCNTPDIKWPFPPAARTLEAVATLRANGIHVFVYGFQDYEDIFEQTHRFGFAYQFDGAFFNLAGGSAYNYHQIIKKKN